MSARLFLKGIFISIFLLAGDCVAGSLLNPHFQFKMRSTEKGIAQLDSAASYFQKDTKGPRTRTDHEAEIKVSGYLFKNRNWKFLKILYCSIGLAHQTTVSLIFSSFRQCLSPPHVQSSI